MADDFTFDQHGVGIQLGGLVFTKFSIPEVVKYSGKQRLVVHKQPGGARQIDVLGRDDDDIEWDGIFLGADALALATQLDAMRIAGDKVRLVYGAQSINVVIHHLSMHYHAVNWVDYRIAVTPVTDGDAGNNAPDINDGNAPAADAAAAGGITDQSGGAGTG